MSVARWLRFCVKKECFGEVLVKVDEADVCRDDLAADGQRLRLVTGAAARLRRRLEVDDRVAGLDGPLAGPHYVVGGGTDFAHVPECVREFVDLTGPKEGEG